MLENVDLSLAVNRSGYKDNRKMLEVKLGELQRKAWELKIPIIFVFEGWHASGMSEEINRFILPLDPRGYDFHTIDKDYNEDLLRPFLMHFWTLIPKRGRIAIFDRSWYSGAILKYLRNNKSKEKFNRYLEEINWFERQLSDDGYLVLKFFLHISEKKQEDGLKETKKKGIPLLLSEYKKKNGKEKELDSIIDYKEYLPIVETMLEKTDMPHAPWNIVEANDKNFTTLKILTTATHAIENWIEQVTSVHTPHKIKHLDIEAAKLPGLSGSILDKVNLSRSISFEEYSEHKKFYQQQLKTFQYELLKRNRSMIIVFEGWDAAGKGGNIRRLVEELNPRIYRVVPVGAPNDIEITHHYLWRFCEKTPKVGHITIFDRSWYGRVLVERVEGFCSEGEWKRAYREINEFENVLTNTGTIILKFWLHIDKNTQLDRFNLRHGDPQKSWKITEEDWRNRNKWEEYTAAIDKMLKKTSTSNAQWTVVESNDKRYSRIKILKTVAETLESELKK